MGDAAAETKNQINKEHQAFPKLAIIAMFPTRGGWRAGCTCGWQEKMTHRSEKESNKIARKHEFLVRKEAPHE